MFSNIRKDNIKASIIVILIMVLTYILYLFFSSAGLMSATKSDRSVKDYDRLVSFAPGITEMVYVVGLGDKLVANTLYCNYPEAAKSLPKIGAYSGINYELLLALDVDAVILYSNQDQEINMLNNLGIDMIEVKQDSMDNIVASISQLGSLFNKERETNMIIKDINDRLEAAKCSNYGADDTERQRVVFIIYRGAGMSDITVVADDNYFNDMINRAGGVNIFSDTSAAYPIIDKEAIIRSNPDIIIEVLQETEDKDLRLNEWYELKDINAVKNGKIFLFDVSAALTTGPRFIDMLEQMVKVICSAN